MAIPTASNFPTAFDSNDNLYEVHDALRVRLAEDYNPGDTSITIFGDEETIRRFPPTGLITLTEQCSDVDKRAISFYYGSRTLTSFNDLEILPGFQDVVKPKNITNVTQNVMASHHNAIKDAVIAIQKFAGKKGEIGLRPLEGTLEARINFLRKLVLTPKAWFSVNKTVGLVPLTVEFKDLSFRLGTDGTAGPITYIWDFGDNSGPSIVTISATSEVPVSSTNVLVEDLDGGTILKTYTEPGIYDVSLTVRNDFGEDTVVFPAVVNARLQAPDEAVIKFKPRTGQIHTAGTPNDGPYTTIPTIRTSSNTLIDLEIDSGVNPNTGRTYAGEEVDENNHAIDPVITYTWSLADDLEHTNSPAVRASYSVGGIYDLILRVDTKYGAYRITTYEDAIDVVEKENLWLWNYNNSTTVSSYEFGLISETFKAKSAASLTLNMDDSFLDGANNEEQQKREFARNNGFAKRGTTSSGSGGTGMLFWASGRSAVQTASAEKVLFSEYNGFTDTYISKSPISRPWNWAALASSSKLYFILGGVTSTISPNTSPTNQTKHVLNLSTLVTSSATFGNSNYKNGADELQNNLVTYDESGEPLQGHMSVYRTTWKDDTGFLLRNDGVGAFFRLRAFYKTSGNTTEPFLDIRKLPDMAGPAKIEGQLVTLKSGIFFFNNSGAVSAYNPTSGVWETGGPGVNSAAFRLLQDNEVIGFDDANQTLVAASDSDRVVYLSFDYSTKAFIKFNETDTTFSRAGIRPDGTQWQMTIF